MSTLPSRPLEPARVESTILGKSVIVKGHIISHEDLTIDGEVEGIVELKERRLTVGPNGKVMAGIKTREIVVFGSINGTIEASDRIDLRKGASVVGDIRAARIVIEDGAYFKGNVDIIRPRPDFLPTIDSLEAQELDAVAEGDISEGRFGSEASLEQRIQALATPRPVGAKTKTTAVPAAPVASLLTTRR